MYNQTCIHLSNLQITERRFSCHVQSPEASDEKGHPQTCLQDSLSKGELAGAFLAVGSSQ